MLRRLAVLVLTSPSLARTASSFHRIAMAHSAANGGELLHLKRLSPDAILPVRGSEHAAGYDLSAAHAVTVPPGGKALVKTDWAIAIPPFTYARIAPRSGLAWKKMIATGAGVVDYDYRGNVGVVLFNHGTEDFAVEKGDRIAQLILERISMAEAVEVDELPETTRGVDGFGSTGGSAAVREDERPPVHTGGVAAVPPKPTDGEPGDTALRGQLLLFVRNISTDDSFAVSDEVRRVLKSLALKGDPRLAAAMFAYQKTNDPADLADTLGQLLVPI
jgi:dUTP pyrophosphatase